MTCIKLKDRFIGDNYPCLIIGEIGINHNGSIDIAKRLIDVAVESGCEAVKFQKRTIDVVYSKEELDRPRDSKFGDTNGDLKRGLEFGYNEYKEIDSYCKERGVMWTASPWDEESVDFLERFDVPFYKIASASLTDKNLLMHIKSKGKPIILSTGLSTMNEVRESVRILKGANFALMHTVSTYPSENNEVNLSVIKTLKNEFPNIPIGYSGHERGIEISVCAVALGACVVERHITLDRTMWGSDQSASIEPKGLSLLVRNIRIFEDSLGDGIKVLLDREVPIKEKLRRK